MYRSVVPSLRGTGCSASPSVLPGNMADSVKAALAGLGREAGDVDEADDLAGVGGDVGDHRAAVGVPDEHDRPVDVRTRSLTAAASAARPRSGFAAAMTR